MDVSFENGVMHVIYSMYRAFFGNLCGKLYIKMQCNSNATAFDGARYTKVETTQRCCCLDVCRSMTEYGPELKLFVPESACEGFFVKKQPLYYIFTPSHLLIYIFTPSHLLIYIFTPSHLLIYTSSHPHIC